jgi:peptide/nickel transport system ATP-binding protein
VGESGSGKSTVARCIVRPDRRRTAGHMMMGGEAPCPAAPGRRAAPGADGVPGSLRSLNPRHTVGESIIERPAGVRRGRASRRLRAPASCCELVGLSPDALNRYPHEFSGGQRQRIGMARAAGSWTRSAGGRRGRVGAGRVGAGQVLDAAGAAVRQLHLSMLFITHDLRVAAQICDTIMVMQRGKVVETGSAETVLTEPRHEYTRALIDAAPGRQWK